VLPEDAASRRQPILDQVVVELKHGVESGLDLSIRDDEGEELEEVEDDLNDN